MFVEIDGHGWRSARLDHSSPPYSFWTVRSEREREREMMMIFPPLFSPVSDERWRAGNLGLAG